MSDASILPAQIDATLRMPPLQWGAARPHRTRQWLIVALAHFALLGFLWHSVVPARAPTLVPVSLAFVAPQAEIVETPKPRPQHHSPARPRMEPPPVLLPVPEVVVETNMPLAIAQSDVAAEPPPAVLEVAELTRPAPPRVELPSSSADYLSNPVPPYPALSKRLQEQGRVLLWVLVDAQGSPAAVELKTSSGFHRLDAAALETVARWKFVPGRRGGIPAAMWVEVPMEFRLS